MRRKVIKAEKTIEVTITISASEVKLLIDHLIKVEMMKSAGMVGTPGIEDQIGQRVLDEVIKVSKER